MKRSSSAHDLHNISSGLVSFSSPAHTTDLEGTYDNTDLERSQAQFQHSTRSSALNHSDTFERLFDQARYELQHGAPDQQGNTSETWTSLRGEERNKDIKRLTKTDQGDTQ